MTGGMTTAAGAYGPSTQQVYKTDHFSNCEKCGNKLSFGYWTTDRHLYSCNACGFKKSYSHVSFGLIIKVPNYLSLTETHAPNKLFFADGSTLEQRMRRHKEFYVHTLTKRVAHDKWEMWIKENTIEIIKLASLSERHNLGANLKLAYEDNPMIHLKEHINKAKGIYLHFVTMRRGSKKTRKAQTIGDAISYGLKKSKSVVWLGGCEIFTPDETLRNAAARLYKPYVNFYDYKDYNPKQHIFGYTNKIQTPTYMTGPSLHKSGKTQEEMDIYTDKFLTDLNDSLPERDKFKVIINTGNTGIETSVIRWAIRNSIYSIVVNLPSIMYLSDTGYNRYDTLELAIERLTNRRAVNEL